MSNSVYTNPVGIAFASAVNIIKPGTPNGHGVMENALLSFSQSMDSCEQAQTACGAQGNYKTGVSEQVWKAAWTGFSTSCAGTTKMMISFTLNASQAIHQSNAATTTLNPNDTANYPLHATDIIVPNAVNGLARGDTVTIQNKEGGTPFTNIQEFEYGGFSESKNINTGAAGDAPAIPSSQKKFSGNMLDATSATTPFLATTTTAPFSQDALKFTIKTPDATSTFRYTQASPIAQLGEFNNLSNLAAAINATQSLTARVSDGRLYVGGENANNPITFENGQTGSVTSFGQTMRGIDWVSELGVKDVPPSSNQGAVGIDRFNSLASLVKAANSSSVKAFVTTNVQGNASASFSNLVGNESPTFASSSPSLVKALGLPTPTQTEPTILPTGGGLYNNLVRAVSQLNQPVNNGFVGPVQQLTGPMPVNLYPTPAKPTIQNLTNINITNINTTAPATNATEIPVIASGTVTPHFERSMTIYDAKGKPHDIKAAFLKTAENTWRVEVYSNPASDIKNGGEYGLISQGTISFNNDGSIRDISDSLEKKLNIQWKNGAANSSIAVDWNITQGNNYRANAVSQNGAPTGTLQSITINKKGEVIGSYSNGEMKVLFNYNTALSAAHRHHTQSSMLSVLIHQQHK